jgi:hypothetical protein
MRAGKIIHQHRHGKGRTGVHRLTVIRPGPIGDAGMGKHVADQFVDIAPHLGLTGLDIHRTYDRRGNIMRAIDESHVQGRTGGVKRRSTPDTRAHGLTSKDE